MTILAHGGTAGAIGEVAFIVVPIVVFWVLSTVSRRRREREEAEAEAEEAP
jgi:large-conductance mechanosensitive channel